MVPRHKDRARTDDRPMATAFDTLSRLKGTVGSGLSAVAHFLRPDPRLVPVTTRPRREVPPSRRGHSFDCE